MGVLLTRPKRKRRKLVQIVTALMSVVVLLLAWSAYRWFATPAYWTSNQAYLKTTSQDQLVAQAQRAEQVVFNGLASSQDGQPVDVTMPISDVNAWLAVRLKVWLANLGKTLPKEVGPMMVTTQGQNIIFAIEMHQENMTQIVSLVFAIHLGNDGRVALKLNSLRAGDMPVKASWLSKELAKLAGPKYAKQVMQIIEGKKFGPWFDHPAYAAYQMRLLGLDMQPNQIAARIQTKRVE